jgi:hypothetical protein
MGSADRRRGGLSSAHGGSAETFEYDEDADGDPEVDDDGFDGLAGGRGNSDEDDGGDAKAPAVRAPMSESEEFTMKMFLEQLHIEPELLGYNPALDEFV